MSDRELLGAIEELARSIREQNEVQREIAASNRALTEMLAHTIDAVKDLTEELNAPLDEAQPDEVDDIKF